MYKVMTPERVDACKKWAVQRVKEWHDKVRPDYIILTETSAVPYGWLLKSAWKEMYPDEKIPKFFRSAAGYGSRTDEKVKFLTQYFPGKGKNNYITKRSIDSEKTALIFDEMDRDRDSGREGLQKASENGQTNKSFYTRNNTLNSTVNNFVPYLKNIWIDSGWPNKSMHATGDLHVSEIDEYTFIKPTRKGPINRKNLRIIGKNFTGVLEKNPKLRKKAFEYIHDLKLAGKEAGIESREQQEHQSLENRVISIISIGSLVSSLAFLSSNFTGNVIGNNINSTSSWIGIILFLVGVVGAFFYFKRK